VNLATKAWGGRHGQERVKAALVSGLRERGDVRRRDGASGRIRGCSESR
jgi:hypothetical protein